MTKKIPAVLFALALGTAFALPAAAQDYSPYRSQGATYVKAKKHVRHVRTARSGGQIACTAFGCHPVPAGCKPVRGFNWAGDPLDYDLIACR